MSWLRVHRFGLFLGVIMSCVIGAVIVMIRESNRLLDQQDKQQADCVKVCQPFHMLSCIENGAKAICETEDPWTANIVLVGDVVDHCKDCFE